MFQDQFKAALEAALLEEFKANWATEITKIPASWLAPILQAYGETTRTTEYLSDLKRHPALAVAIEWSKKRAAEIMVPAERIICDHLIATLDDAKKPAAPGIDVAAIEKAVFDNVSRDIQTVMMEREHLTGRINALQAELATVRSSANTYRTRMEYEMNNLTTAVETLTPNLTSTIKATIALQDENETLREYIRQLQRKIWPKGVPTAYRIAADKKETKRSPRKSAAK